MVLIVNLNTTIDKTYIINNFKVNKIFRPEKTISVGGGKGVNVARVLNYLKIQNKVIGFVGGYNKSFILQTLKSENIKFIPVGIKGNSRVCTIILDLNNSTETVINENGPAISRQELKMFLLKFKKEIRKAEVLVLSGSMPLGVPYNFYYKLLLIAKKYKVRTVLDTSKEALAEGIKASPDILKVNKSEISYVYKNLSVNKVLFELQHRRIKFPVITLGEKGSVYLDESNHIKRGKIIRIEKVSTIGSGDAFTAGLVAGIIKNTSRAESIKLASELAALNALTVGAGNMARTAV